MKSNIRKNQAITLIALVITIIVLLILAGVTIASLTGNNGLLARAASAEEETEKTGTKEQISTEVLACYDVNGEIDETMLATNLKHITGLTYEDGSEIEEKVELPTTVEVNGNLYSIYSDGRVEAEETHTYSDETKAKLTEGKYVTYQGKSYIVLYDANSGYGWIEIISESPLKAVSLGSNDPKVTAADFPYTGAGIMDDNARKAAASYNRAITTLHEEAQEYLSNLSDRARCVGSDPKYPTNDVRKTTYTNGHEYMETYSWNNRFKVAYSKFSRGSNTSIPMKDKDKMDELDIRKYSDKTYGNACWWARRVSLSSATSTYLSFGFMRYSGGISNETVSLLELKSNGTATGFRGFSFGLPPSYSLKVRSKSEKSNSYRNSRRTI